MDRKEARKSTQELVMKMTTYRGEGLSSDMIHQVFPGRVQHTIGGMKGGYIYGVARQELQQFSAGEIGIAASFDEYGSKKNRRYYCRREKWGKI